MESPPLLRKVPGAFSIPARTPVPFYLVRRTNLFGSPIESPKPKIDYEAVSLAGTVPWIWSFVAFLVSAWYFVFCPRRLSGNGRPSTCKITLNCFDSLFTSTKALLVYCFASIFASLKLFFSPRSSASFDDDDRDDNESDDNRPHYIDDLPPPHLNLARHSLQGSRLDFILAQNRTATDTRSEQLNRVDPSVTTNDDSHRKHLLSKALARAKANGANQRELEWIETRFWIYYNKYTKFDIKEKLGLQRDIDSDAHRGRLRGFFADADERERRRRRFWDDEEDEGYESTGCKCHNYSFTCTCSTKRDDIYSLSSELKKQEEIAAAEQQAAEAAATAAAEKRRHRRQLSDEKLKVKLEANIRTQETKSIKRRVLQDKLIRTPSHSHLAKIDEAMTKPDQQALCRPGGGDSITKYNLAKLLNPTGWLDDVVIMSYLNVVTQLANRRAGKLGKGVIPKIITLDSLIYPEWVKAHQQKKDLATVPNGLARKCYIKENSKLLDVETMMIPVNQNLHWTLLVISPKARKIEYIDSFRSSGRVPIMHAKRFLASFLGPAYKEREWEEVETVSPRQTNGYDCGVFVSTNGECIASGVGIDCYDENDLQTQRKRMAAVLLNEGFGEGLVPAMDI